VNPSLLPRPLAVEGGEGGLTLRSPLRVACDDRARGALEVFAADLAASVGWDLVLVASSEPCDLQLRHDPELAAEHYGLRVDQRVVITAAGSPGFAHALTVLRQMGPAELFSRAASLETWTLPALRITDGPRFAWRGAHLDVARHFFDVDVVLRFIDLLAAHRLNSLHLHINDDQGWRVEVPAWPRLTSVGAWRRGSPIGHEDEDRRDEVPHGGFYDAADIAAIVAHAARRHVQLVPEIDLPGHAQAVLAAYPEFGNTDEELEVWTHWGISTHVLNVAESTLAFADEVLRYVAGLFPGSPVHIGGDECPSEEWAASEAARAVMAAQGFEDPRQLQGLYTCRLAGSLRRDGHAVLAWDEVLDADVPDGVTICAWRSAAKGVEAAERGLDVIMAPMQDLYFDWLSSDDPAEPVAVAPRPYVTTWEKVYGFSVLPEGLDARLAHHVIGAQAQLWTEYIDSRDRLDYMAFPRLCAFAEVAWGTAGELAEFRPRLEVHLARLDAMGVAYRPLDAGGEARRER